MLNIATGYSNYTLYCSELNGEHAGEGSDRYETYFCRYERVNPKNVDFRENFTFDLT